MKNVLELLVKLFPFFCKILRAFTGNRKQRVLTALIVEDNRDDSFLLELELRRHGIICEIATTAETARGLVKHVKYDLCFIDMRLPGMPGEVLLRVLSEEAPSAKLVIVCGEPYDIPEGRGILVIRKSVTFDSIKDILAILKL